VPATVRLPAWRLLVALSALVGVLLAAARYDVWWTALSQLASLAAACLYLALAVRPRSGRRADDAVRGGVAVVMVLVAVGFWVVQQADRAAPYSWFEHGLTPALVLLDVVAVSPVRAVRPLDALAWLVPPAAYLAWYVVADLGTYTALDPADPLALAGRAALLAALALLTGAALVAWSGPRWRPPRRAVVAGGPPLASGR